MVQIIGVVTAFHDIVVALQGLAMGKSEASWAVEGDRILSFPSLDRCQHERCRHLFPDLDT